MLTGFEGASEMRLFVAALMVVAIFGVVVLIMSRLFPYGAGWAGVCVAITCLYAGAFGAWVLIGNETGKNARAMQGDIVRQHSLKDNLLYFAVAMAAVTIAMALTIHDTERGIDRNFRNDWFVGFVSACFALGYATKAFLEFPQELASLDGHWSTIRAVHSDNNSVSFPNGKGAVTVDGAAGQYRVPYCGGCT
jgi:hypothetical protein